MGCESATALAPVAEVPLDQIDRQLAAWPHWSGIRRAGATLSRAIREDWPLAERREADPGWVPLRPSAHDPAGAVAAGILFGREPVPRTLGELAHDLWPAP